MTEKDVVAIGIVAFILLVWKPLSRAITQALDTRSARIEKELAEATKLREEAQALLVSFQRKQRDAMKEADDIVAKAKADASRLMEEAEAELECELNKRIQMAMEKIEQSEQNALQDVKSYAVDVAVAAAHTMLKEQMKSGSIDIIDDVISDARKQLN